MSELAQDAYPGRERDWLGSAATDGAPVGVLQIRMLGPFQVRRADGSIVDPAHWRTGKVADLVRLLALQVGDPVPARNLIATLWPGADQRHGQASLRTAAYHVRQVLGTECLERNPAGLRLRDCWVDVSAFRMITAEVHRLAGMGDLPGLGAMFREADELYRGDLRAHDENAEWVRAERQSLIASYLGLLCDAAEGALAQHRPRDAVDFAGRALVADPFSERSTRLLMRAYAEMGEILLALGEFEKCRTLLADTHGIDPSPQTRELHMFLRRSVQPA